MKMLAEKLEKELKAAISEVMFNEVERVHAKFEELTLSKELLYSVLEHLGFLNTVHKVDERETKSLVQAIWV